MHFKDETTVRNLEVLKDVQRYWRWNCKHLTDLSIITVDNIINGQNSLASSAGE